MLALLLLYKWAVLAGVAAAPVLALLGCHLAARDRAMQTLCIGQGASLGVLVGLAVLKALEANHTVESVAPFVTAILFSVGTFYLSERVAARRQASRNTFYAAIFAALLSAGYLLSALVPALESHMAQVFFGDLATLSDPESWISLVVSLIVGAILVQNWRTISGQSFNQAVFGEPLFLRPSGISQRQFDLLTLVTLSLSVQFLGFLFTISCLFLPTVLASHTRSRGLPRHFLLSMGLAGAATLIGFCLSLGISRLPTVPTLVLVMIVMGLPPRLLPKRA